MKKYGVRVLTLAGVACFFVMGITPVRSQQPPKPKEAEPEKTEEVRPAPKGNPEAATTTEDVDIPVDELQLIVKPLTLAELRDEAAGWMLLLKTKATEISQAEVAIKRQNFAIAKQEEGANALEEAQKSLEEAEELKESAAPGSPEYEEAAEKVEEAKENFKQAQEAVEEAQETNEELAENEALQDVLEKAEDTGDLENAQKALDDLNQERDEMVAGSFSYDEATEKIDTLEAAIAAVEEAKETQAGEPPDSPEYQEATQQLEIVQGELNQLLEELGISNTEESSDRSSEELEDVTAALEDTEIDSSGAVEIAGPPDAIDSPGQLEEQQEQLEETTEQLEESAEAESEEKNQLVIAVTELQAQQTAIVDRFNVILDELERKGGNAGTDRQYIQAVSTIELDIQDSEGLGLRLLGWAKSEEGGLRWVNNTGTFLGVLVTSILVAQILGVLLNLSLSRFGGVSVLMRRFIVSIVKRGGIVVGFLLALTALEVSLGPILTLLGGVSFVLAFALQSNLGNLASGLMIMAYKPFDVGDEVKVGGLWGKVDSITLANTKIKGFGDQIFTVPNNAVWGGIIENLSSREIRKLGVWLRMDFDQDLSKVEPILVEIAKSHPKILDNPPPKTLVWEISDYYIKMKVAGWVKKEDFWKVHQDLIRMIQKRFAQEGIAMAAVPKQIEIHESPNGNGKMADLASENIVRPKLEKSATAPEESTDKMDTALKQ
ncbi:MAG: mechanosensitive ion channel [Cyanobacteriota bacterium]|nr:mechanosensitive ion channel [Cyanobacteriota bacterium]